jgi:signal transduction histidine kinase
MSLRAWVSAPAGTLKRFVFLLSSCIKPVVNVEHGSSSSQGAAKTGRAKASPELSAVRDERLRLAQLLHDTICQELAGICLSANASAHQFRSECPEAEEKLKEIAEQIRRAGCKLQDLMRSLQ